MPRYDYDQLTFRTDLPKGYSMIQDDQLLFGTFRNMNVSITHGLDEWDNTEPYLGLDICPADGAGNNIVTSIIHTAHCLLLFVLIKIKRIKYIQKTEVMKNRKNRPLKEKLLIKYGGWLSTLLSFVDEKKLVRKYYEQCRKYDYYSSKYICVYSGRRRFKELMKRTTHGSGKAVPFENIKLTGYSFPEMYLEKMYGKDYMCIPSENKREKHGEVVIKET
jgi:lipopolysaccharide cholinephosphotransferase